MSSGVDGSDSSQSVPVPVKLPDPNAPPPFLSKTYDMVDDPSSDDVVSWGAGNNSFVIWKTAEFGRDLLPKYFKHNNFSSFVRQLNTYGFRKVHADRWEFANEGFLRGKKHLLKTIKRRKASHGPIQPQVESSSQVQSTAANACVEVGKLSLEEDVEMLKREKNVLVQEVVTLRQKQQTTEKKLHVAMNRLQLMDQRQQQLMSFLAKVVRSPGFLTQFVQQQTQNSMRIGEASKKRRLKQDTGSIDDSSGDPGGVIVKYQPSFNNASTASLLDMMEMINSSQVGFTNNGQDNFFVGDGSSSSNTQHVESSMDRVIKPSIPEFVMPSAQFCSPPAPVIPPCGASPDSVDLQPSSLCDSSEVGTMVCDSQIGSLVDKHDTSLALVPDMAPETTFGNPKNNSIQYDPSTFGLGTQMTFDIENISPNDETIDMSAYEDVWKMLSEEIDSAQLDDLANESGMLLMDDDFDHSQNIDHITDQMGLLTSNAKNTDIIRKS